MKKNLSQLLLFLSLLSLVSCTLTKRKYTGGFYVDWHRPHPTLSYQEREKSRPPQCTSEAVLRGKEMGKLGLSNNNISTTCKPIDQQSTASRVREIPKNISSNRATSATNQLTTVSNEGSIGSSASDRRFLDNGLTGFEAAIINLLVFGLLILFLHLNYGVFIVGCILLMIAFTIYSLVYCFKGLNSNDKHRGLALAGLLIDIGIIIAFFVVGG